MVATTRRLALCAIGSGLAFLAGCADASDEPAGDDGSSDGSDDGGPADTASIPLGDLPPFATAFPAAVETPFFGAVDLASMANAFEGPADGEESEGVEPTDPLLRNPLVGLLTGFSFLLGLGFTAAASVQDANDETEDGGWLVVTDETAVLVGAYDLAGISDDASAAGFDAVRDDADGVVFADENGGYAVGASADLFAISFANEALPALDPVAAVERHVEAATGETALKHERDEAFERLLRTTAADGIVVGLYGDGDRLEETPVPSGDDLAIDASAFAGAVGVSQHLEMETGGNGALARATVHYDHEEAVDEPRLEASLGTQAQSTSLTRDGTTVRIDAEYDGETVDEFDELE
ncbi:hypothetical protein [Natronobiforma cellulositropha]|uniref:hypothetical protein n=1 Tax=Natronobiforma cellulositropha TaxID=1679076 RepID=UPI0021D5B0E5|nr:hypothetical protein [Natronobiforma cellulositropha]